MLAIEHDGRMRRLIRANLEAEGLVVQEAVSVQHGLALLRESQPGLILLDLDMPDLNARHLLGVLGAQLSCQPVPVILMSSELPERWLMQNDLATSYLQKPFAASALLQQVRLALGDTPLGR